MNDYPTLEARVLAIEEAKKRFVLYSDAIRTLCKTDPSWVGELRALGDGLQARIERFDRDIARQLARGNPRTRTQVFVSAVAAERVKARLLGNKSSGVQTYGRSAQWDGPSLQSLPRTARPLVPNMIKLDSV